MDRSEPKSAEPKSAAPAPAVTPTKAPSAGPGAATSVVGPSPASSIQRPWLLRKRSSAEVMRCADLPTLRQWIVERRIARDDEISRSGQRWRRMGSVVEFESLFYSAEQERAQTRRTTGQFAPVPALPTSAGATLSPRLTPVPTPVATTPGSGTKGPRPTPVPTPAAPRTEARSPEPMEAKKPEPAPVNKSEPNPVKKPESIEAKKPEPVEAKKPEPAPVKKPEPQPAASAVAASPPSEKKPAEASAVGPVRVTPPPGLAAAGGLSPMRLARKDPNRGKPQAMPGMAGSVQAAMRAAGTPPGKPAPAAGSEAKRPEPAAPPPRGAAAGAAAGTAAPRPAAPAATGKPAPSSGVPSSPGKAGSTASGAQTALFARGSQDSSDSDGDSDVTRKMSTADSRAAERQRAGQRDAVEDAILRNDPVPRHLKEAAESGGALRKAPANVDSTEFIDQSERGTPKRRWLFLLLAAAALGVGIWFYSQSGDTPTGQATGDRTATPPGATGTTGTTPATGKSPGTGTPTAGPETAPPVVIVEPLPPGTGTGSTDTAKPEPPAPTKVEPAQVEPAKPEPPTTVKPEPQKPEPAKPAVAKPEPSKPIAATPGPTPATGAAAETPGAKPAVTLDDVRKKIGEDIPKSFDDQMELAQRLVERYKYDSAQLLYEYMLTYASAVPAIHNGLGTCAFEKNRGDEAIQHYRNALERRPSYSAAVFGLAKTYHRLKNDKEQALVYYKKYLDLSPKGSAAAIARDAIAKLEGTAPAAPPAAPAP